ncbi:hypothetical protein [Paraliomyxa miuraensis]|uniref:hypothetical protein n=1 Tax=Paraliomyxa miuraensis TaxID=376150 RepID=UPI002258A1F7|nr:hypothetical protein [Paraliomyxa miuraensis]MCX4243706.1 hypothetical protein [Paraliomyxa miuraensis]
MILLCATTFVWSCGDDTSVTDPTSAPGTTMPDPTATGPIDPTTGGQPTSVGTGEDTTSGTTTEPMTTSLDSSSEGPGPVCGNDVIEADEPCDGTDLGGATCVSEGFDGGSLACADDCSGLDTSGCSAAVCGNATLEGSELCDGAELGGATCLSEGFDGGTLACANDCSSFDTDECSTCGNVIVEGDEPCDGVALLGESCEDQGFDSGQIACLPDCSGFDTTSCGMCGNGVRDGDELCDGMDLGGESCLSQGLGNGNLGCLASCQYSFVGCELASGVLLTVRTGDGWLRALDPFTLAFTDIGPLGVGFDFGEVAYDTTNGILWMIDGRPLEALYTVNMATGAASLVGVHGIDDLFGLAHDPTTNTLFGSGESPTGFYSMNTMTGAASLIGDPAMAADGLTYDSTRDQIVALAAGGGTMYSIDRMTGAPTVLSNAGFIDNCGLAYDPFQDLYWAIDWSGNLYTYDPNMAYTRTLVLSGLGSHDGLTYVQGFAP